MRRVMDAEVVLTELSYVLRIVTNRLDLSAELIAEMYRLRWLIEMFFRTFKITSPRDIPGGVPVP